MKHLFQHLSRIHDAASPRTTRNSAAVVRLFVFLMTGIMFLPALVDATSVVVLIDNVNHRVVIATDCRVNRHLASLSQCKIIDKPGCTVAMAGLYEEKTTAFHLRQLAEAACQYPGDLRAKAEAFLRFSKIPYERAVRHIRATDPSDFGRTMANKPTEVIFAGVLRGHLTLFVRGFVSDPKGRIAAERYESTDGANSSIGYFAGLNRVIREHVKSHDQWERIGYVAVARQFVEMEIQENPDLAGPPITELEIDDRGRVHWISKGACDDAREAD